MATQHFFNGKQIKLPGAYSAIKSVSPIVFTSATYSKALIINTDKKIGFGGSINGEVTKGKDSLYRFRTLPEAQSFFKSGKLWQICSPLFNPSKSDGTQGISELYYINALTTKAPTMTPSLSGEGKLIIQCKDEGPLSNGSKTTVDEADLLTQGYALSIITGERDTSKYIFQFWLGTFKGLYTDNIPYDGISAQNSVPELVLQSPEVSTIQEFVDWANSSEDFTNGFSIKEFTDTELQTEDKTNNTLVLATGGTAEYSSTDLEDVLKLVKSLDFNVIFSLNVEGEEGSDVINARLQTFVQKETRFVKFLAIPGKSTGQKSDFETNCESAKGHNSERVWLIHGTPRKNSSYSPLGYRIYDSTYLTAAIIGRTIGLPPQVPVTFKDLDIDGLESELDELQKEDALDYGVLTVVYDEDLEAYVVLRGINTLKENSQIQNPDGTSFSIQITRICAQLNQDLVVNAKKKIFGTNTGANANTVSPEYMEDWTRVFLSQKVATPQQDNIILGYSDVSTERKGDALYTTYKFETNTEIAFAFFTGFAVN